MQAILRWFWRKFPGLRRAFGDKVREAMLEDPRYTGKFLPYRRELSSYLVKRAPARSADDPLPLPPADLRWGMGTEFTDEHYLAVGKERMEKMGEILQAGGGSLPDCKRILDFGCASGTNIRWLVDLARGGAEIWGVDISGAHMLWCQQHLTPPFKFATTTSTAHLPFEDNTFDLIYAGSVFTHIADLAEAWLLELRRIVRPGGYLYLTVHDEHTLKLYYEKAPGLFVTDLLRQSDPELQFSRGDWDFFTLDRMPGVDLARTQAQVFYRREYLQRHWGQFLKVISITPEAFWIQSAVLLQKPQ